MYEQAPGFRPGPRVSYYDLTGIIYLAVRSGRFRRWTGAAGALSPARANLRSARCARWRMSRTARRYAFVASKEETDASACIRRHQGFVLAPATVRRVAAAEATCSAKTSRPRENYNNREVNYNNRVVNYNNTVVNYNNRENKEMWSQKVDGPRDERGHKR